MARRIEPSLFRLYLQYGLAVLAYEHQELHGIPMDRGDVRRAVEDCLDEMLQNRILGEKVRPFGRPNHLRLLDRGYTRLYTVAQLAGLGMRESLRTAQDQATQETRKKETVH